MGTRTRWSRNGKGQHLSAGLKGAPWVAAHLHRSLTGHTLLRGLRDLPPNRLLGQLAGARPPPLGRVHGLPGSPCMTHSHSHDSQLDSRYLPGGQGSLKSHGLEVRHRGTEPQSRRTQRPHRQLEFIWALRRFGALRMRLPGGGKLLRLRRGRDAGCGGWDRCECWSCQGSSVIT